MTGSKIRSHTDNPTVLETLQTYRAAQSRVNASIPQNFHGISTSGRVDPQGLKPQGIDAAYSVRLKSHPSPVLPTVHSVAEGAFTARNGMAFRLAG
jgi:hypothetical protein